MISGSCWQALAAQWALCLAPARWGFLSVKCSISWIFVFWHWVIPAQRCCVHSTSAVFSLVCLKVNKDVLNQDPALTAPGNAQISAQFYGCFLNSVTHTTPQPDRSGPGLSVRHRLWVRDREKCTGGGGTAGKGPWEIFIAAELILSKSISAMAWEWGRNLWAVSCWGSRVCTRGEPASAMRQN